MITEKERSLTFPIAYIGLSQIINWGALYYSLALIGPKIIAEMHWSEVFVYSGFSISAILAGLLAPITGRIIDQIGGRVIMSLGSLIGAGGLLLLSTMSSTLEYIFAWMIIGISMSMSLYDSAFATIARIAGSNTRRAISSITLLAGFSSTLTWPATAYLLSFSDWRSVIIFYSIIMASICVPLLFFGLKDRSTALIDPASQSSSLQRNEPNVTRVEIAEVILVKIMVLLGFIAAAQGFISNSISVHVITLFQELGLGANGAIFIGSLIGPAQVGARLIELVFGKQIHPIKLGLITIAVFPISFFFPVMFPSFTVTGIIFGLAYGASNGLFTIVLSMIPYSLFGSRGYGQKLGSIAAPTLLVKAVAPALFGALLTLLGPHFSLSILFFISLLICFAMLKLAKLVKNFSSISVI